MKSFKLKPEYWTEHEGKPELFDVVGWENRLPSNRYRIFLNKKGENWELSKTIEDVKLLFESEEECLNHIKSNSKENQPKEKEVFTPKIGDYYWIEFLGNPTRGLVTAFYKHPKRDCNVIAINLKASFDENDCGFNLEIYDDKIFETKEECEKYISSLKKKENRIETGEEYWLEFGDEALLCKVWDKRITLKGEEGYGITFRKEGIKFTATVFDTNILHKSKENCEKAIKEKKKKEIVDIVDKILHEFPVKYEFKLPTPILYSKTKE